MDGERVVGATQTVLDGPALADRPTETENETD
jgi:hypothetical protein